MAKYRFEEFGYYKKNKTLTPFRPQHPVILSLIKKGSKVLDVGCGDGVLGEKLIKQKGCKVWGVDLDSVAIKEAKKRGFKVGVLDINKGLKSFKKNSFDVVVCNEVLEFIKDVDLVVSECVKVGKVAVIEFPNFGFWFYRLQMMLGIFPKKSLFGYQWWDTHQIKFFSLKDFLSLPSLRNVAIKKIVCIDWRNRNVSLLGKIWPNLFGRSCIIVLEKE